MEHGRGARDRGDKDDARGAFLYAREIRHRPHAHRNSRRILLARNHDHTLLLRRTDPHLGNSPQGLEHGRSVCLPPLLICFNHWFTARKAMTAFNPPKAKEFERAASTRCARAWLGM